MKQTIFKGSGVAIITPMLEDGSVNYPVLKELLEQQIAGGTDAIVICGTTGEASALKDTEVARRALTVARRERNMDFDVSLGVNHNTEVRNEIAPAPRFNGVTVGLSVPLKFSNLNKGTVQAAKYRIQQAEARYRQAELEVQTEVLQNLRQYLSLAEQVRRYETGLLEKAKSVIDGKIYSYDRGETPLLEVLNAQRTYDDLRTAYIETLYDHAAALVELERSAGIWDVVVE